MDYGEDYFDDMDEGGENMFDYFDEDEMTPEMAEWLENYRQGQQAPGPLEYDRISASEMLENCIVPTSLQMVQGLFSVLVMSFIFRIVAQLRRASAKEGEGGVPEWMVHFASSVFGVMVLHTLFRLALIYLVVCCALTYLFLVLLAPGGRRMSGPATTALIAAYAVFCELWLVEPTTWHQIRGAQMVLSMKIISLAFDFGSGAIIDLPNIFDFMGYSFHVGTVIFGPWVSYEDYHKSLMAEKLPLSFGWLLKCVSSCLLSVVCLLYSTCFTHWIILDHASKWLLAYRDAQSFRFSHYFVSFMSETTAVLSGIGWSEEDGNVQWTLSVSKPHNIELPRSLVEVVTNWNLPMHYWLKTYVFKAARRYGTFAAVLCTYAASSLLHGLNFQLASVLFSLGFYSYAEFVLREKLSRIFSACIQAKRCKEGCKHSYTPYHPCTIVANTTFFLLSVLHLAYLGLMFDSSSQEEQGYTMEHTLSKWYHLAGFKMF
ncbi:protein-serine O-palmitoleoyltransferase porcupine-like isoform X2 [Littorina saxatilis]|uniref:protein-serine O-palmitoleoyltransferase porcupine-like isoform X2 n=1 Tax=Littorina saxatilis TaxID=31220 RepID=UPI0038B49C12